MGSVVIKNIGKAYKHYPNKWGRLAEWVGLGKHHESKWVLRDISFEINPGESIGIVGVNGAGKSTLLKMIAGTVRPTVGNVEMTGRVAALLELGMGFHPEFTGRQNAVMSAQILGLTLDEVTRLMPKIEEFAEVGDYFDEPVRTYSSGMQMRVAFAVATAHRPDILIVDEALSVGDAYFQHKSFERIREFREKGTTLLIVSHDRGAIQTICNRAILLEEGKVIKDGEPEEVMDFYNALIAKKENSTVEQVMLDGGKIRTTSGTGEAKIIDVAIVNESGEKIEYLNVGEMSAIQLRVLVNSPISKLVAGFLIKDRLGLEVYGTNTHHMQFPVNDLRPGEEVVFSFGFSMNLGPGSYSVTTALHSTDTHLVDNYDWRDLALVFNVINTNKKIFIGCAWLDPSINITRTQGAV